MPLFRVIWTWNKNKIYMSNGHWKNEYIFWRHPVYIYIYICVNWVTLLPHQLVLTINHNTLYTMLAGTDTSIMLMLILWYSLKPKYRHVMQLLILTIASNPNTHCTSLLTMTIASNPKHIRCLLCLITTYDQNNRPSHIYIPWLHGVQHSHSMHASAMTITSDSNTFTSLNLQLKHPFIRII